MAEWYPSKNHGTRTKGGTVRDKTKGGPLRARPTHTFDVERQLAGMSPITPSIKYAMLMSSSKV